MHAIIVGLFIMFSAVLVAAADKLITPNAGPVRLMLFLLICGGGGFGFIAAGFWIIHHL